MIKRFIQDIRELNGPTTFYTTLSSYMIGCIPGGVQCEKFGDASRVA